jgi:hypothetical protein
MHVESGMTLLWIPECFQVSCRSFVCLRIKNNYFMCITFWAWRVGWDLKRLAKNCSRGRKTILDGLQTFFRDISCPISVSFLSLSLSSNSKEYSLEIGSGRNVRSFDAMETHGLMMELFSHLFRISFKIVSSAWVLHLESLLHFAWTRLWLKESTGLSFIYLEGDFSKTTEIFSEHAKVLLDDS